MQKVFWENPYQQHLITKVAAVEGNQILLEETIAYSFSGGQESDKASINGITIIDSKMDGGLITYTLPDDHGITKGEQVEMKIDWPRRYRLMRLHFAAELVLEIVTQKFNFEKVGAHISESKSRIDFLWDQNISSTFETILAAYNAIIERDIPIQTGFTDVASQKRFWKIDGFAKVPCGGTHVKSTGEVGFVTLKRVNLGGGKERIEIRLVDDSVLVA
jgi:Ser-tRNA(Ala) deacylase AlaX